jgi:GNAT superfamily N-acetyltransferase
MTMQLGHRFMSASRKTPCVIRPATADDSDFILSLVPRFVAFELPKGRRKRQVAAAIRVDIARALREAAPGEQFFVAEDASGGRNGFLHLQMQRDFFTGARTCHVADLAVASGHEGRGIGHALLAHAEKWARAHRCGLLTLSVFPGNARARALYERTGFVPDLLRMTKLVSPK